MRILFKSKKGIGFAMISALFAGGALLLGTLLLGGGVLRALLENKILVVIGFFFAITLIGIFRR